MAYKDNCGFKKLNCCSFKEEDFSPDKCDMFSIPFTSADIKLKKDELAKQLKELTEENLNMPKVKLMLKTEEKDKTNPEYLEFKKKLRQAVDLGKGYEYLTKAYTFCKRAGK